MSTDHLTTTPVLEHLKGYGKYGLKLNNDVKLSYESLTSRNTSLAMLT